MTAIYIGLTDRQSDALRWLFAVGRASQRSVRGATFDTLVRLGWAEGYGTKTAYYRLAR